ncbi:myelocytomatosis oncogene homolog [Amia ocellicauda]|uniref:myelocytomatosis oncogene homolog n=1 Tax=Amia ocellicauda TaxID=2972642 RepID=UPI003463C776
MPQSCSPSRDWDYDSEPLLFDDEFCQNLLKDLQMLPTPPQSPPTKPGVAEPLSCVDQLEFVSELLLEDQDFLPQSFSWGGELIRSYGTSKDQRPEVSEDCLWRSDKGAGEKLSSSPLLSDIDTDIFQEIAATTLHCQGGALECSALRSRDLLQDSLENSASSSEDGSLSGSASCSGSETSASDSEEEIDVVTVEKRRRGGVACAESRARRAESQREQQRAMKRCHLEIQQQHNYAAPCPSPSPSRSPSPPARRPEASHSRHKRVRTERQQHGAGRGRGSGGSAARLSADMEEEERRRTHNVMERQRRNELKNCFLRLRDHVPELSNNDKASKVVILKKARECIRGLEGEGRKLGSKSEALRHRQDQLKHRLEQLSRVKAAH